MAELTRDGVLRSLADHLVAGLDWQITDPAHAAHGGIVRPEWGIAQAGGAVGWLAGCALVWLGRGADEVTRRALLARAFPAAEYLLRIQRPSGLIDLPDCNYDSS